MAEHWSQQQERSNVLWLSLLAWSAVTLGRGFLRCLCLPIALFFLLTARDARRESQQFLQRVLPRKPTWRDTFRHFYTFALISGDRLLFLAGRGNLFELDFHGEEIFTQYRARNQGCIMVVSHLGSFDAMRVPGVEEKNFSIRILIDRQHNQAAMQVIEKLNPSLAQGMIDASLPAVELALRLDECLAQGDMVGIMADRAQQHERTQPLPFLGEDAHFPVGPWQLAMVLKVPVVVCFAIYQGKNRYSVHFEEISSGGAVARAERKAVMAANMALYVNRLEHHARAMPYNWFNFYNFWQHESSTHN